MSQRRWICSLHHVPHPALASEFLNYRNGTPRPTQTRKTKKKKIEHCQYLESYIGLLFCVLYGIRWIPGLDSAASLARVFNIAALKTWWSLISPGSAKCALEQNRSDLRNQRLKSPTFISSGNWSLCPSYFAKRVTETVTLHSHSELSNKEQRPHLRLGNRWGES